MTAFGERLQAALAAAESPLCIGLDIVEERLPAVVRREPEPVLAFARAIIEATADLVCAYKPNLAFYERLGSRGFDLLRQILASIPRPILTIADAKRGDIASSAAAYAQALFEHFGFDACTVNPYLGGEALQPFLDRPDRGVFVLCRTSNPGAGEFQDLQVDGRPLYLVVAERARRWNRHGNVGLVVGATYPQDLRAVRAVAPDLPFLVPGVGTQGGDLTTALVEGSDRGRAPVIINVARQVLYASAGEDFALAARTVALQLRETMRTTLARVRAS